MTVKLKKYSNFKNRNSEWILFLNNNITIEFELKVVISKSGAERDNIFKLEDINLYFQTWGICGSHHRVTLVNMYRKLQEARSSFSSCFIKYFRPFKTRLCCYSAHNEEVYAVRLLVFHFKPNKFTIESQNNINMQSQ